MYSLTLEIATDNAAFEDDQEISRIIKKYISEQADYGAVCDRTIRDINGNVVGELIVTEG